MIVTLIIAIKDETDLPSGHKRKKAGDIIAVCPENHTGGALTRKTHLLVKVDLGSSITTLEDAKKLMIPYFETGEMYYPEVTPKIIGKRRYKVPIADITTKAGSLGVSLDMGKLQDKEIDYQPLEKKTIPFANMIKDEFQNKKITTTDLTSIAGAGR